MLYPLAVCAVGVVTSIIGTFFVRLGANQSIMGALYKGFIATGVLSIIALWPRHRLRCSAWAPSSPRAAPASPACDLYWCGVVGLVVTALIIVVTEYYTGTNYRPVRSIAEASSDRPRHQRHPGPGRLARGHGPAGADHHRRHHRLLQHRRPVRHRHRRHRMLSVAGVVVALDAFGPVTDNAGGIAEMAGLPKEIRKTTDALDAVGNTTKAVTKGYAIGSAGLGALVLFAAYNEDLRFFIGQAKPGSIFHGLNVDNLFSLSNPYVVVGLFFGGLLPYLFGGIAMTAVGRAAGSIVEEVRRQFREKPGIMKGTEKPDYARAVDMLTRAAIKEMIVPSLLPVLSPIVCFFVIKWIARHRQRLRRARRHAARRHRHRPVRRHLHDGRRRRLGQRQEVHRGRPLRRQGLGGPQGRRDRRHRRRSLQGHRRPGGQPDDQDHQHRGAAAAGRAGALTEVSRSRAHARR